MIGPQDPAAAGRPLRAGHADREQAIDTLKTAFVHGRPDQGRTRRASGPGARRADLRRSGRAHRRHPAPPARSQAGAPARPGPPQAAGQGGRRVGRLPDHRGRRHCGSCALLVAADGHYRGIPGANPSYESWAPLALLLAFAAVCTAIGIIGERGGHLAGAAALPKAAAAPAGRPRPGSRAARRHRP